MTTTNLTTALFGTDGVRIADDTIIASVVRPEWRKYLKPPLLTIPDDFANRWMMYQLVDIALPTPRQFHEQARHLRQTLYETPGVCNLFCGVCLPIILPAAIIDDPGTYLERIILPAVGNAYHCAFPDRAVTNYRRGSLSQRLKTVPESNHTALARARAFGPVVGLYFPDALRGWSVLAARQQMASLPSDLTFVLPDAIVHGLALVGYPDILARDGRTPTLDCAANAYDSPNTTLRFDAEEARLTLGIMPVISQPDGSFTSGLLYLGRRD